MQVNIHRLCSLFSGAVTTYNFFGDVSMLFYLVNAVIIGYMAGALNNGSTNFKRMLRCRLNCCNDYGCNPGIHELHSVLEPARHMAQGLGQ